MGCPSGTTCPTSKAHGGDDAAAGRAQHRVVEPVLREFQVLLGGVGVSARLPRAALRTLVVRHADRAVRLQRIQALAIRIGLAGLRDGSGPLLPCRFLGQPVVGVVEHGEDVALVHELADIDLALGDLAADAEGLVHLVARLHGAGVAVELRGRRRSGVRTVRTGRGACDGRLVRAAGGEHGGYGQGDGRGK